MWEAIYAIHEPIDKYCNKMMSNFLYKLKIIGRVSKSILCVCVCSDKISVAGEEIHVRFPH